MPPRPLTAPRKKPTQARATATVDAILEATARILSRDGYDLLSTNRVAEAAGVSIGSLYQYFPSKDALLAALVDKHREAVLSLVVKRMAELSEAPLRVAVREMVRAMIELHLENPKLHRVLFEQVPRVGKLKPMLEAIEVHAAGMVRGALEARKDEVRAMNLDLAAFLVSHAVESLTHAAVIGGAAPGSIDEVTEEITRLVLGYLEIEGRSAVP